MTSTHAQIKIPYKTIFSDLELSNILKKPSQLKILILSLPKFESYSLEFQ